jgi:transposase
MESVHIERLDHLGLIASVIKDLGLIRMIDARIVPDEQEEITPGEAVAGMIRNGLGFANRPLSLTPQFFANKSLDLLFREGIRAEMFNRFKLGRTLDEVHTYGCDLLFSELALAVCVQEGIEPRFHHLDTTSFSLSGDYVPESDEQAIHITHGYSKDHRPDLKQAVLELLVSQDGGVPLVSKSWDGNTSDTQIFQERAQALMTACVRAPTPRYLVADAKLYTEDSAVPLSKLGFVTRIPGTLKLVSQVISQALKWDRWHALDDRTRYQGLESPPAFQNRSSRGPHPREHLRLQPPPSSAVCPGCAKPRCALLRAAPAGCGGTLGVWQAPQARGGRRRRCTAGVAAQKGLLFFLSISPGRV